MTQTPYSRAGGNPVYLKWMWEIGVVKRSSVLASVAFLVSVTSALASTPPMQVRLIQSGGECASVCPEWIAAYGRIDASTPGQFVEALKKLKGKRIPVVIDSPGGSVAAAIAIGRLIRSKGLDVVVGKSILLPCDPILVECRELSARGFLLGRILQQKAWCASACSIVIAGGVRRFVGPDARIGIHAMAIYADQVDREWVIEEPDPSFEDGKRRLRARGKDVKGAAKEVPDSSYDKLATFYDEMGILPSVIEIMKRTPHSRLKIIRSQEALDLRLATHAKGPREVLFGERPPTEVPLTPGAASHTPLFRR